MIILEIKLYETVGGKSYLEKEIKKWPPDVKVSMWEEVENLKKYDLEYLTRNGIVDDFCGYPGLKEFRLRGSAATKGVQYRLCFTITGFVAWLVDAYKHKAPSRNKTPTQLLDRAYKRAQACNKSKGSKLK